ncbi:MAG: copper chaperone PCu(A)C [Roseovarius sp.]
MKNLLAFASAIAIGLSAHTALAHDYTSGNLQIIHPFAFETHQVAKTGAGFMTITNTGGSGDTLLEIRSDFPKVEIHTTEETEGVARMIHVETLPIPAGETVELAPGGYHVMFMGLDAPFEEGQKIPATLVFRNAGEVEVTFNVEPRPESGEGMDHSSH